MSEETKKLSEKKDSADSLYSKYQHKALLGGAFWSKFASIFMFIGAGFTILGGIPMLLFFGLGIIYLGLGVLYIFLGIWQWKAGEAISQASEAEDLTEAKDSLVTAIAHYRTMYKALFISYAVLFGVGILLGIVFILLFASAGVNY